MHINLHILYFVAFYTEETILWSLPQRLNKSMLKLAAVAHALSSLGLFVLVTTNLSVIKLKHIFLER